jgi:hypothetical protein
MHFQQEGDPSWIVLCLLDRLRRNNPLAVSKVPTPPWTAKSDLRPKLAGLVKTKHLSLSDSSHRNQATMSS